MSSAPTLRSRRDGATLEASALPPASRRAFTVAGLAACAPSITLWGCASPEPLRTSADADDRHATDGHADYRLANRLTWGATDAELDRIRSVGPAAYIAAQLQVSPVPRLPTAAQVQIDALRIQRSSLSDLVFEFEAKRRSADANASEEARKAAQQAYQQDLNRLARETASRHLLRALYSPDQLQEQMAWFWFNHFNVHQYKHNLRVMLADYEERAIRPHALGRFRALLGAVAHHPAMLRYLDNDQNAAGRLNENFARELLELHTLGVDGGYTQRDVQELARVLTGHGVNLGDTTPALRRELAPLYRRDGLYEFNPARHDGGAKTVLGQSVRARGAEELDEVLDRLAMHPATARFVSRKIARHLLADEPPPALVDRMASAWLAQGGAIRPVLQVLLSAPEFLAPGPGKFKDPMHFVVSAVRACHADRVVRNTAPMQGWLNRLGQGLYNRATPDGYPSDAASWSSSGQMAARFDVARALSSGGAGLFRPEGGTPADELPAFPQLARPIYYAEVRPVLGAATREALDAAPSPQEWTMLYLAAPEFMYT